MGWWVILLFVGAGVAAALLTALMRGWSLRQGYLDVPNLRSSHSQPTPSGGGLAIVLAWLLAVGLLTVADPSILSGSAAWLPPALLIAVVGFVDDRRGLPRRTRILAHLLAVIWFFAVSDGVAVFAIGWLDRAETARILVGGVAMIWLINLFNFMDGIDGLAISEALFVTGCFLVMPALSGHSVSSALLYVSLAGACAGFLALNWPPAKIFMGDAGSYFLGFVLGSLALRLSAETEIPVWTWLIVMAVFVADATVTLLRRVISGQRWYDAHRSHAYQILARRWNSHRAVTVAASFVNVCWLLPLAAWSVRRPENALDIMLFAYLPLLFIALRLGAGRREV